MSEQERIRLRIAEIAARPKNVTFSEIEWVVNQLRAYHPVSARPATHGVLFQIVDQTFMVCTHNPGSKQVKAYCVKDFINAMIELGWFES